MENTLKINIDEKTFRTFLKYLKKKNETAGLLKLYKKNNEYFVKIREESVNGGDADEVYAVMGPLSFHSHPLCAYEKHNTNLGWPSITDFKALLYFNTMILHYVIAREGIWVIRFHSDWIQNKKKYNKKKVEKKIEKKLKIGKANQFFKDSLSSIYNYKQKVNNFMYKGKKVFHIYFYKWKHTCQLCLDPNVTFIPCKQAYLCLSCLEKNNHCKNCNSTLEKLKKEQN